MLDVKYYIYDVLPLKFGMKKYLDLVPWPLKYQSQLKSNTLLYLRQSFIIVQPFWEAKKQWCARLHCISLAFTSVPTEIKFPPMSFTTSTNPLVVYWYYTVHGRSNVHSWRITPDPYSNYSDSLGSRFSNVMRWMAFSVLSSRILLKIEMRCNNLTRKSENSSL